MKRVVLWIVLFCAIMSVSSVCSKEVFADNLTGKQILFTDVPDTYWAYSQIMTVVEKKILAGYPDGNFYPEKNITRAEMAAIVFRIMKTNTETIDTGENSFFEDVDNNHWAKAYINAAAKEKIISGDGNGKFRPEDNIKYEEAIKMIVCAFGEASKVEAVPGEWATGYLKYAESHGMVRGIESQPGEIVSRSTVAVMLYNELNTTKRYGVKWNIDDADDIGNRCFDSIGLSAEIGVGSIDGKSDFDNIYPWSEIKRCNIKIDNSGENKIVFEGEREFSLDGSNGNVFVRIPKFYVEKYIENGYEYRVISAEGNNVHPAFIEDGKELDEIYISAFEGYISNGKMYSIADVIPTSNKEARTFLKAAQNNGVNYSLYDMRCVDAVWTLMAVEYGCRNTNHILGYGVSNLMQPVSTTGLAVNAQKNTNSITVLRWYDYWKAQMPVGTNITICKGNHSTVLTQAKLLSVSDSEDGKYTTFTFDGNAVDIDETCYIGSAAVTANWTETCGNGALGWHTGRADFVVDSDTANPIRYRWIENPYGNLWQFLPDITFLDGQIYICENMKDYKFGSTSHGYFPVETEVVEQNDNGVKADVEEKNYWISSMNNDLSVHGISFGDKYDKSLTSKKGFGAYYYMSHEGVRFIANGGGFDHLYRCNMLTHRAWITPNTYWYLYGARMMYKNID